MTSEWFPSRLTGAPVPYPDGAVMAARNNYELPVDLSGRQRPDTPGMAGQTFPEGLAETRVPDPHGVIVAA